MYGFHFDGNYGYTDQKMFLLYPEEIIEDREDEVVGDVHHAQDIDSVNCLRENPDNKFEKNLLTTNCWICEGWSEVTFTWRPG
jgi:hypothetical protein